MPSSVLCDQVPHSLLFPYQPFFVLLHLSLDACALSTSLLMTSFQLRLQSASSLVIPDSNEAIDAISLIHIDTSYLLMSPFLSTPLTHLFPPLPALMSYPFLFSFLFKKPHIYLRLLYLAHFRFILAARALTSSLRLTHLLWRLPPRHRSCRLSLISLLPFGKVFVLHVILFLVIHT